MSEIYPHKIFKSVFMRIDKFWVIKLLYYLIYVLVVMSLITLAVKIEHVRQNNLPPISGDVEIIEFNKNSISPVTKKTEPIVEEKATESIVEEQATESIVEKSSDNPKVEDEEYVTNQPLSDEQEKDSSQENDILLDEEKDITDQKKLEDEQEKDSSQEIDEIANDANKENELDKENFDAEQINDSVKVVEVSKEDVTPLSQDILQDDKEKIESQDEEKEKFFPIKRKHIVINRQNISKIFDEYLDSKTDEERKKLEGAINTIILK